MEASLNGPTYRPWGTFSFFVERHQVWVFLTLLLVLSWPYMFLVVGNDDSDTWRLPLILIGPSASAFATVYAARGLSGAKELGRKLFRAQAPRLTYFLIFLGLPIGFLSSAYAMAGIWYPDQVSLPSSSSIITAVLNFGIIFLFAGLGEEFGWRGLVLPRLQSRCGPLTASLFVGLMWSFWHFPLTIGRSLAGRKYGVPSEPNCGIIFLYVDLQPNRRKHIPCRASARDGKCTRLALPGRFQFRTAGFPVF